jgi:hypothetical protein
MSDSKPEESASLLPAGPRQQYHYLYGSSSSLDRYEKVAVATNSPTGTDRDSLVGEALVPTDNEQDDMTLGSEGDLQQLLVTHLWERCAGLKNKRQSQRYQNRSSVYVASTRLLSIQKVAADIGVYYGARWYCKSTITRPGCVYPTSYCESIKVGSNIQYAVCARRPKRLW